MLPVEIIRKKRDGKKLTKDEISLFINGYLNGTIPDYQMSAFLMAIYFQGMDFEETICLTEIMLNSGHVVDLSDIPGIKVDKHSTGGVGDKVSLILAPIVASAGVPVPMISGRGLGHTGGTLDKLESIPGFKTNLSIEEFKKVIKKIGFSIISQTEEIAPCDKILYSLRDATGTIESNPLITASIMSKKLSEGIDGLVLDVKAGKGAFMKKIKDAEKLAENMVWVGKKYGVKIVAILTDMDTPLGRYIGNSLEIYESIKFLEGEEIKELKELTFTLGAYMLILGKKVKNFDEGFKMMEKKWKEGKGILNLKEFVKEQGGNIEIFKNPERLKESDYYEYIKAEKDGIIEEIDAYKIGLCARELGAGRFKKEDNIDPSAGIIIYKKEGEKVKKGEIVLRIQARDKNKILKSIDFAKNSFKIGEKFKKRKLIKEIIK